MRITPQRPERADAAPHTDRTPPAAAVAKSAAAPAVPLLSAQSLERGAQQLQALPEIDQQKIADIRAALARGEIGFDAQRLAATIAAYHRG